MNTLPNSGKQKETEADIERFRRQLDKSIHILDKGEAEGLNKRPSARFWANFLVNAIFIFLIPCFLVLPLYFLFK